jgi:type I restriction enzyme M protein
VGIKQVPEATKKNRSKRQKEAPARSLEATLWAAADKLRGHMDAAEYKHVVLGLIFLKYISDAFEEHQNKLREDIANPKSELYLDKEEERAAALEDRDEYIAANIFWVPQEARWSHLRANAKQPTIGKILDDAMVAIERDNPMRGLRLISRGSAK